MNKVRSSHIIHDDAKGQAFLPIRTPKQQIIRWREREK